MAPVTDMSARINLRRSSVLVVDGNPQALDLMRQMLAGFGVRAVHATESTDDAREMFHTYGLDLIVIDPMFTGDEGFGFIRWARREEASPNRCTSIVATMGHQTLSNVRAARDAGANAVLGKPLSPEAMLQRIMWTARETRPFVVAPGYVGPDRRFKNEGPPPGTEGRRVDDLSIEVPKEAAANMSQFEVDELFKPRKVAL